MTKRLWFTGLMAVVPLAFQSNSEAQCSSAPSYGGPGDTTPAPASPAGNSPSSPSNPAPAAPESGAPGSPSSPGSPSKPDTGRGEELLRNPATRGPTAKSRLKLEWEYPVYSGELESGRTTAAYERRALPLEKAFREIAGEDRRPLLVLRECHSCSGTDDALLNRTEDNEKTLLMSRWFRCIKLPPDVIEHNHPFHTLFAGEDTAHLFVSCWDGTGKLTLNGAQSRRQLWQVMEKLLRSEYERDPTRSLGDLFGVLGKYDRLDKKIIRLEQRLDALLQKEGRNSAKLKKVQVDLEEHRQERKKLRTHETAISEIELREPPPAAGRAPA